MIWCPPPAVEGTRRIRSIGRGWAHVLRSDDVDAAAVRATVADEAGELHHLVPEAEGLDDGPAAARANLSPLLL